VESLAKKYDEKFKAAAEVNAQLALENAALKDAQVIGVTSIQLHKDDFKKQYLHQIDGMEVALCTINYS